MTTAAATEILSPRLQRMRDRVIHSDQEISIVRSRAITDVVKEHPDIPRPIQLALGLKESFRRLPISIGDDEHIVGALTEKFKGAIMYPELKSDFLIKELDNFSEREYMRFRLSDEDKRMLRENILPHWEGKSAYDDMISRQGEDAMFLIRNVAYVIQNDFSGANHLAYINYRKMLEIGFEGIIDEARKARSRLLSDAPEDEEKKIFFESVILAAESVIEFAGRYSQLASEMADAAPESDRLYVLREISEIAERVPGKPARTFREAIQALWFTYLALTNLDGAQEIPVGRIDQYLYPYYREDIAKGRIAREEALELIEELFIKFNQLTYLGEYAVTKVQDGNPMRPTVTVGGIDADGKDAVNELSFLILEAADNLRLIRPNIAVRLHPSIPEPFWESAIRIMTNGGNVMEVFNDETLISGFVRQGFPSEAARDYLIAGCVQQTPASTYGPNCSAYLNGPKMLEMFLNDGAPVISLSGDDDDLSPPQCDSYEELWEKFKAYGQTVIESLVGAMKVVGETQHRLLPNPILSCLIDGTLESGKDVKAGGARHNLMGMNLIGLGTLTDSLAAIKHVVFDKKSHSLEEIMEWIKADFEDYEAERQMLLNHVPKYGNGDRSVDVIASEIVGWVAGVFDQHTTYRNGAHGLGLHSETHHIYQGSLVAATPDGRGAGEMLSPGCGPTSGMDRQGPTASLRSIAAVDHTKVTAGSSVNMRFNPLLFRTREHVRSFEALLKAYFKLGGPHLQITVADVETLRDAQRHPERYENLLVRITGYSARFVELTPATQEEVIRRTEMNMCA